MDKIKIEFNNDKYIDEKVGFKLIKQEQNSVGERNAKMGNIYLILSK